MAFRSRYYSGSKWGIFSGSGGTPTLIAAHDGPAPVGTFHEFWQPAISGGTVAFTGTYDTGSGVFTGIGGTLTTIAKTGDAVPSVVPDATFTTFSSTDSGLAVAVGISGGRSPVSCTVPPRRA